MANLNLHVMRFLDLAFVDDVGFAKAHAWQITYNLERLLVLFVKYT